MQAWARAQQHTARSARRCVCEAVAWRRVPRRKVVVAQVSPCCAMQCTRQALQAHRQRHACSAHMSRAGDSMVCGVARCHVNQTHNPARARADKELESMFSKELKRRGLDSLDDVGSWQPKEEGAHAVAAGSARKQTVGWVVRARASTRARVCVARTSTGAGQELRREQAHMLCGTLLRAQMLRPPLPRVCWLVAATSASAATSKSPFATKTNPRTAQAGAPQAEGDQRQRSIALVNEGLEVGAAGARGGGTGLCRQGAAGAAGGGGAVCDRPQANTDRCTCSRSIRMCALWGAPHLQRAAHTVAMLGLGRGGQRASVRAVAPLPACDTRA
jgi:hypothetical protein